MPKKTDEKTPQVEQTEEPAAEVEETPAEAPLEAETPVAVEETETVAEVEPAEEAEDAAAAAEAPEPAKAKSRKRLPRPLRRQRPRRVRATSGERKPLQREPKPEGERGARQERRGVVVSSAMDKTIVVRVDDLRVHPRYKKVVRRSTKFHAHDEQNAAKVGDVVRIVETRPLSKTKRWRLAEVVEAAK
jgi:ribosomal protein uS17